MHIRFAALIIVIATLVLSFNSSSKSATNYKELATMCLGNKGRMSDVVAACNTLINAEGVSDKHRRTLLKSRGWAYYCGKEYDLAIADYSNTLSEQPDDVTALVRRARAFDASGDTQAAEADYSKALLLKLDSTYVLFNRAKFDRRRGALSAAILGLEKVLEIDPSHGDVGFQMLTLLHDLGGDGQVDHFLRQAEQNWPDQTWVYYQRLLYDLQITRNHESALKAVSELARLKPGPRSELFFPALVHLKIGDEEIGIEFVKNLAVHQKASSEFKATLPKRWLYNVVGWFLWRGNEENLYRGYIHARIGRSDLAMAEFETAFDGVGRAGRKELLGIFHKEGVSVPRQAYAGSSVHIKKAISDFISQVGKSSVFSEIEAQSFTDQG